MQFHKFGFVTQSCMNLSQILSNFRILRRIGITYIQHFVRCTLSYIFFKSDVRTCRARLKIYFPRWRFREILRRIRFVLISLFKDVAFIT